MVRWALRTTFETVQRDQLKGLHASAGEVSGLRFDPISLLAVILAGNVFTASVRAIFVPLLFGVPVVVKASSAETLFPTLIRRALYEASPELGSALEVVSFAGGDHQCESALLELAEMAAVYGSDRTVEAVTERIMGRIPVIKHGHGVSAAYCGARSLRPETVDETTSHLAVDIAAYDQRGCLSPQAIYVQYDQIMPVDEVAAHLSGALEALSRKLPRGPLPEAVGAAQTQWRGVAEADGNLVGGHEHAIAIENRSGVRWSPGYRNATLVQVDDLSGAFARMTGFARHLKCVGADPWSLRDVGETLRAGSGWSAYATELGTMQTPALDAPADGRPVWAGLLRSRQPTRR